MIAEGRPCADIAQQLQAVEKAITNAKRELIFDHIDHCLTVDDTTGQEPVATAGFKNVARYL